MKVISIVKYTFTVIGLGMFVGAFFLFTNTQDFLKNALTTNGVVIELVQSRSNDSYVYRPLVEFVAQSGSTIEFTTSSGSNPPSYSKDEIVEVLYQESFPEQARINGFFSLWGAPTILGGLGAVFFLIGFTIILVGRSKRKKIEYLRKNGVPIKTKFKNVEINKSLVVNGKCPYKIYVQWENPTTSKIHIFNSDNIWIDPTDYINTDEITVLIERDNPKKYHMDISFLPEVSG